MTNLLYSLVIFNDRLEGFFIGLFESSEEARQMVVERGHKYHHVPPRNLPTDGLYIVLLDTGALISAVDAAGAGVDIPMGHIDHLHRMSGFFRPLTK